MNIPTIKTPAASSCMSRDSSEREKAELQNMSVPMKTEERVTYGDPMVVSVRAKDPSACADVKAKSIEDSTTRQHRRR
jgi:hypothetical protein